MALFRPGSSKVYTNGFAEIMDIVGQNYRESELVALHQAKPGLKVIGTENGPEPTNEDAPSDVTVVTEERRETVAGCSESKVSNP